MSEFESEVELSVVVPQSEVRGARAQIEDGLSDIELGLSNEGGASRAMSDGGARGGVFESRRGRRMFRMARERTELQKQTVGLLDEIQEGIGSGGMIGAGASDGGPDGGGFFGGGGPQTGGIVGGLLGGGIASFLGQLGGLTGASAAGSAALALPFVGNRTDVDPDNMGPLSDRISTMFGNVITSEDNIFRQAGQESGDVISGATGGDEGVSPMDIFFGSSGLFPGAGGDSDGFTKIGDDVLGEGGDGPTAPPGQVLEQLFGIQVPDPSGEGAQGAAGAGADAGGATAGAGAGAGTTGPGDTTAAGALQFEVNTGDTILDGVVDASEIDSMVDEALENQKEEIKKEIRAEIDAAAGRGRGPSAR